MLGHHGLLKTCQLIPLIQAQSAPVSASENRAPTTLVKSPFVRNPGNRWNFHSGYPIQKLCECRKIEGLEKIQFFEFPCLNSCNVGRISP
jgi:hypothetical protein